MATKYAEYKTIAVTHFKDNGAMDIESELLALIEKNTCTFSTRVLEHSMVGNVMYAAVAVSVFCDEKGYWETVILPYIVHYVIANRNAALIKYWISTAGNSRAVTQIDKCPLKVLKLLSAPKTNVDADWRRACMANLKRK